MNLKTKIKLGTAAALLAAPALVVGAGPASALVSGNNVCIYGDGAAQSTVYDAVNKAYVIRWGQCSSNYMSNPQAFTVQRGWYCKSQWGYVYDGGALGARVYHISQSNVRLNLSCYRA